MLSVHKTFEWDQIDTDDIQNAFHTLEGLVAGAVDGNCLDKGKYYVATESGIGLHDVRQIREELEPTGEKAKYISVEWARPFMSNQPLQRVTLTVSKFGDIGARVEIWGSNSNETHGFMEITKKRIDAGLKRSNAAGWPHAPAPHPVDDVDHVVKELTEALTGTSTSAPTPATASSSWQMWWQKVDPVMRHPLWSALTAGFIVGLTVLALTIWLT